MAAPGSGVFVATETFATVDESGSPLFVHKGATRVREGHDLLRRYPHYFEQADMNVQYDVEEATAAPGEKRGERGASKSVSKKVAPDPGETTAQDEDRGPGNQPVRGAETPKIAQKGDKEAKS